MLGEVCMEKLGLLRSIADEELELMRSWRNDPSVRANMYSRNEVSPEEHLAWWARTKVRPDQRYFMYELDAVPNGIAAFNSLDFKNSNSAWAFYAAPGAPRGSGSKMEFLMLEHAFETLGLHKLYCEVLAFNSAVIKLHQRFAFRVEGIFKHQHKVNNEFVDVYRLGIFAAEWREHRHGMLRILNRQNKKLD
jgi:UDP-4-amino-4,6-dideoxy-N-acetyl-beta-L-altrosamine N-acetyltransferase